MLAIVHCRVKNRLEILGNQRCHGVECFGEVARILLGMARKKVHAFAPKADSHVSRYTGFTDQEESYEISSGAVRARTRAGVGTAVVPLTSGSAPNGT
jgi:hypothetical protein